jgi:predicted dehydrogenase
VGIDGDSHPHPQLRALPRELLVSVSRHADVDFVGVWDDDRSAAQSAARRTRFVASLDELLARSTPSPSGHRRSPPVIERAAARGKHVLCEKPIATTRDDARAIAASIERSGVRFMQSFPKRFDPANHEIRRRLEAGFFGTPWLVRVRHGHRYGHDAQFTGGGRPARSAAARCCEAVARTSCAGCSASGR